MIKPQLSHGEQNKVNGAYNEAQQLSKQLLTMQRLPDYLNRLKTGEQVILLFSIAD